MNLPLPDLALRPIGPRPGDGVGRSRLVDRDRAPTPLSLPKDPPPGFRRHVPDRGPGLTSGDCPGFLVQEWLARTEQILPGRLSSTRVVGAYAAHLDTRISYTGPIRPIDLWV